VAAKTETPASVLSHRERQIVRYAAQGRSDDEIARRLYVATTAVRSDLSSAFEKLAATSRR
jgi:DNA-binding CsgD family transcriptional regulator